MPPARLVEVNAYCSSLEERRYEPRQCLNRTPFGVPATRWRRTVASAAASRHQVEPAGAEDPQLGEPHDRFQGATNLKGTRWSKPPQPGGTARAERVREVATPGRRHPAPDGTSFRGGTRKQLFGAGDRWEWTPGADADGGANFDNPKRGVLLPGSRRAESRKARRPTDRRETGRRIEDSVFVGEAKVMRAGPLVDPTPRRA